MCRTCLGITLVIHHLFQVSILIAGPENNNICTSYVKQTVKAMPEHNLRIRTCRKMDIIFFIMFTMRLIVWSVPDMLIYLLFCSPFRFFNTIRILFIYIGPATFRQDSHRSKGIFLLKDLGILERLSRVLDRLKELNVMLLAMVNSYPDRCGHQ